MRKHLVLAGILLAVALVFAGPSKADSVVNYSLSGGISATFSLPGTITAATPNNILSVFGISGTLQGASYLYGTVDLGNAGQMGTNYWAFGSSGSPGHPGPEISFYAPGLITINGDGTVTLNGGIFTVVDPIHGGTYTLTATVIPDKTPEPATLALLGVGGLALAGLRRRKA